MNAHQADAAEKEFLINYGTATDQPPISVPVTLCLIKIYSSRRGNVKNRFWQLGEGSILPMTKGGTGFYLTILSVP
jgi:hypothetical protein